MRQTWSAIVWCHWPVAPEVVAPRLPPGVHPDLFDGSAWVGLVPFEMRNLRLVVGGRSLPAIPTTSDFSEVNVRTYVTGRRGPGVWFDTLDASSRLGSLTLARGEHYGYNISKAALNMATVMLAKELGRRDVTVFTMSPGWVRTDMGGPHAELSVEEAMGAFAALLDRVGPEASGRFLDSEGQTVPW